MSWLDDRYPRHRVLWGHIRDRIPAVDLAHDRLHVQRVYGWALRLAPEAGARPDLAGAAALVHDLVNVPKESAERSLASAQSAAEAAPFLVTAGYKPREYAEIAAAVRSCSWSAGLDPVGPVGVVLQDADRLDAIGAIGIARTFVTAQSIVARGKAMRLYDPEDPVGRAGREPDESVNAVDHFRTKLLRLADGMHLPSARDEAVRRHQLMVDLLDELEREVL